MVNEYKIQPLNVILLCIHLSKYSMILYDQKCLSCYVNFDRRFKDSKILTMQR